MGFAISRYTPFLQLTWHLWGGTWKMKFKFLLKGPPVIGREGKNPKKPQNTSLQPNGTAGCDRNSGDLSVPWGLYDARLGTENALVFFGVDFVVPCFFGGRKNKRTAHTLPLTWHLTGGPVKRRFILRIPPHSCHASGREGYLFRRLVIW